MASRGNGSFVPSRERLGKREKKRNGLQAPVFPGARPLQAEIGVLLLS
jgi:hypothetical protein